MAKPASIHPNALPARKTISAGAVMALVLLLAAGVYDEILLGISLASAAYLLAVIPVVVLGMAGTLVRPTGREIGVGRIIAIALVFMIAQAVVMVAIPVWVNRPGHSVGIFPRFAPYAGMTYRYVIAAVAMCMTAANAANHINRPRLAAGVAITAAVAQFVTVLYIFGYTPAPLIDVWEVHRDGSEALAAGKNPYGITLPNLYAPQTNDSPLYPLELQKNGRVLYGYPYLPLSLLVTFGGWLMNEDARYILSACVAATAVLIPRIGRGPIALLAAAFFMLAPTALYVEHCAWTEPQLMLALAAVAWAGVRRPKLMPVMIGLMLSLKQYSVLYVPLLFLVLPRPLALKTAVRFLGTVAAVVAGVTLPLALWDWHAFYWSCFGVLKLLPVQPSSLTFLPMIGSSSGLISWAAVTPVVLLLLWRAPRNVAGFVGSVAVTTLVFFLFARQSYLNYHAFVASAFLIAAAAVEGVESVAGSSLEHKGNSLLCSPQPPQQPPSPAAPLPNRPMPNGASALR